MDIGARSEKLSEEISQARSDIIGAAGKYKSLVLAVNPAIPEELIQGSTIADIDASLEKAKDIVEKVKASILSASAQADQAQTQTVTIPPGAPPRSGQDVNSLSSTEKIRLGLQKK